MSFAMAVSQNVSSLSLSAMWDWSHSGTTTAISILDAAADLLVLERNFAGALELCERGLQITAAEPGDTKCEQVKASLCVIGIQALAELERWREALPWLLQYYTNPQEMPHNIMEMCKVKQPRVMLDLTSDWLKERANQQLPGYVRVAELHLLRTLLPLGLFSEAEELARDSQVFTGQQQQVILRAVSEKKSHCEKHDEQLQSEQAQNSQTELEAERQTGDPPTRLLHITRLLCGTLAVVMRHIRRIPLRQIVLALLMISVIVLRLDPASPISLGPVSRLLLLLRSVISSVFQTSGRQS
ncbi:peroxisome assembly protein 26 isoform 2-T2 [Discoglossus pictus]